MAYSAELSRAWNTTTGSVTSLKWVWSSLEVGGATLIPPSSLNCNSVCPCNYVIKNKITSVRELTSNKTEGLVSSSSLPLLLAPLPDWW